MCHLTQTFLDPPHIRELIPGPYIPNLPKYPFAPTTALHGTLKRSEDSTLHHE